MSLNSSLQTLGQLMATNLQSKGVTANASDGLTTLANKILQVESTPIGHNLKLTSNKNILSFYNHFLYFYGAVAFVYAVHYHLGKSCF